MSLTKAVTLYLARQGDDCTDLVFFNEMPKQVPVECPECLQANPSAGTRFEGEAATGTEVCNTSDFTGVADPEEGEVYKVTIEQVLPKPKARKARKSRKGRKARKGGKRRR